MPAARFSEAMWSAIMAPTGVGSSPSTPLVEISPPAAWALRSLPSSAASGPAGPKVEPVPYTRPGFRAERTS